MSLSSIIQATYGYFAPTTTNSADLRMTKHRDLCVTQTEPVMGELARSGRLFYGGTTAVAGGIGVVSDYPTTTAAICLYNGNAPGVSAIIDTVSFFDASGTEAAGATLVAAVAQVTPAQAVIANASSTGIASARGMSSDASGCFVGAGVTTLTANYFAVGSSLQLAAANLGQGVSPFGTLLLVPPGYAGCFAIISGAGTSAKYGINFRFALLEQDLFF